MGDRAVWRPDAFEACRRAARGGDPHPGHHADAIDLAEDRERFQKLVNDLGLKQPVNGIASSAAEAVATAERIGFPLVIRPAMFWAAGRWRSSATWTASPLHHDGRAGFGR